MPEQTFLDWFFENLEEFEALHDAEEGNPYPLADFIVKYGALRTVEARGFVSDRLLGKPKKRGQKRTTAQVGKELAIYNEIKRIMRSQGVSKNKAIDIYIEHYDELGPRETIRDYEKKGEKVYLEIKASMQKKVGVEKRDFRPKK